MCGCDWVYSSRVVGERRWVDYDGGWKTDENTFLSNKKKNFEIVSALTIDYLYFQFLRLFEHIYVDIYVVLMPLKNSEIFYVLTIFGIISYMFKLLCQFDAA